MPNGYTYDVYDGKVTDFRTFALRCARAFGATIEQRDEDIGVPPRLRKVDDFHAKYVEEYGAEWYRLSRMLPKEAEAAYKAEQAEVRQRNAEYAAKCDEARERYEAMLEKVRAYDAPEGLEEFKSFMLKQLKDSRDNDCPAQPFEFTVPEFENAEAWRIDRLHEAETRLAGARKRLLEHRENVRQANEWITALYASLEQPPAAICPCGTSYDNHMSTLTPDCRDVDGFRR